MSDNCYAVDSIRFLKVQICGQKIIAALKFFMMPCVNNDVNRIVSGKR
jgi:hypothetical protein